MYRPSLHAARPMTPGAAADCTTGTAALTSAHPVVHDTAGELRMYIHYSIGPLVSLVAGILILVMPRLLNYIVAIYLIVIGIVGLLAIGGRPV
jgi:hypothetical protein